MKVFIITGGYAGVGFELARILVARNATVYIAGRSEAKAAAAISKIDDKGTHGRAEFLYLDLTDLTTIKPAVEAFQAKEQRLDVLVNNAGVMFPPVGSKTTQSHDLQIGTNCLGPYLLFKLLTPILERTASSSTIASVRVIWAASVGIEVYSPKPGGMVLDSEGAPNYKDIDNKANYAQTKVGNIFFAREFARLTPQSGIVHVAFNPGNLRTELFRHWQSIEATLSDMFMLFPAIYGAYTELWAAVADDVTPDKSGAYVWPWGRFGGVRNDIEIAAKSKGEGGEGLAERFVMWCEKEIAPYA